ncbi:ATP-binding protein [Rhodobacteraceae bacterium D3-12]|nr:ATP-binding protein [Rhodobacteraceae bacterium D3-12]
MEVEAEVPERVFGDDVRLRQILFNIIGNAIKFTKTGGVSVKIDAPPVVPDAENTPGDEAEAQPGADATINLAIAVQDTGIGIPADRFERVFEEFGQADNATTRQFGGTGLGLPISRLLARAMGGDIAISSTVGQGSSFVVTVVVEPIASAVKSNEPVLPKTAVLGGMHVLVTDDNATNRMILGKFLADLPITLSYAQNGEEAVEAVARDAPDFVLMDMSMPRMDGLSATRAIRARNGPQPRIIALTANAFASDKEACFEAGMEGFMAKPFRKRELLTLLVNLAPSLRQTGDQPRRA